jgi:hypothetical protein
VRRAETPRRLLPLLAVMLAGGAGSAGAEAHHSIAMFDGKRVVRITGTITGFRWINPHASIQLDGSEGTETVSAWTVEMQAPSTLMAEGWSRESLAAGDQVTLFVNPLREGVASSGAKRGLYVGVILPGGESLGRTDGFR